MIGGVREWLNRAFSKNARPFKGLVGSNPTPAANFK